MSAQEATTPEALTRPSVPALDAICGRAFPVLDQGFVRLIDYMGDQAAIVQAARVSYGKGTKRVQDDVGLIRYLMRNAHTTPFEMCELKLHIRIPMDAWRQMIRHRTASVNEYSTRYSEAIDANQETDPAKWRAQATQNRQGSSNYLDEDIGGNLSYDEGALHEYSRRVYLRRLEQGVAREQARKDLPLSTYTEAYWKIDLHNLLHFLALRLDAHAQEEIRAYAKAIAHNIVERWVPDVWNAFLDYRVNAVTLSATEAFAFSEIASQAWSSQYAGQILRELSEREFGEFAEKLKRLGIAGVDKLIALRTAGTGIKETETRAKP